jgi:Domain of unknown function (DUF4258)
MPPKRVLADDPLELIRKYVKEGKVFWTYHVNMRLKHRFIRREAILESHASYEILEQYQEDKYFPSFLIRSVFRNDVIHIVFAVDQKEDNVRIVTAYLPDPAEWEEDFRTRRRTP